ncbi:hypothetical protein [Methylobacterium goesingense]|uniref:Uncharacterized protein n=1 Tax=Methylobacterium goesingense TaxID=243690 RepID=A0ABV2L741_9HYPH|nr:hypothetical protein [Methylobacterium goesingense]GJD72339.1 hypothetical protein CFIICLFH_0552 [Methylobacterium goesingense]
MSPSEIRAVLDRTGGISKRQERLRKASPPASSLSVPRVVYVWFEDDRALQVEFDATARPVAKTISLTYQGTSFDAYTLTSVLKQYGPPNTTTKISGGAIMAWGGQSETEGAITPFSGVEITLRAEQIDKKQLTITLSDHKN